METGRTIILKDLEDIYGSLYGITLVYIIIIIFIITLLLMNH